MLRHLLSLAVVACFWSCSEAQDSTTYAQCEMMPSVVREDRAGNEVRGSINLRQIARGMTEIRLNLTGFNTMDGEMVHGFHIHEFGDMGLPDGCGAMGGHYNPLGVDHGAPSDMPLARMVGDLGNIAETPGSSNIVRDFSDYMVQLSGDYSVIGRGMIVHSTADDLGLGGDEESLTTGNAGSRVACCVIGSTDGW